MKIYFIVILSSLENRKEINFNKISIRRVIFFIENELRNIEKLKFNQLFFLL